METTNTITMEQTAEQNKQSDEAPTISMRSGKTTFIIGLHFSKNSKETLKTKAQRMIRADVAVGRA